MSKRFLEPDAEASTLLEVLRWRAFHQPDQRAYTFLVDGEAEEIHLTYCDLDRQARAIGAWLQLSGATGEPVLLLLSPGLEYVAAFFGCLYAGSIAVPAYLPRFKQGWDRLKAIATDVRAAVGITTSEVLSRADSSLAHGHDLGSLRWLAIDRIEAGVKPEWKELGSRPGQIALVQYTSGSTAEPKGVMVSHGNLMKNSAIIHQRFEHSPRSRGVIWLPPYHDMGLIGGIVQPVYGGFPVTLMSPLAFLMRPLRWLQAISRTRGTTSGGPNFAYDLCTRKISPERRAGLDLSCWKVAFNGSEPVRQDTLERFVAAFERCGFRPDAFYPCYGLAEATLFVTGRSTVSQPVIHTVQQAALDHGKVAPSAKDTGARSLVGCGHTAPDLKIVIVDPERTTRCAPDEIGEIWVSGPSVALGYWNRPEETEHTFKAYLANTGEGPFLRTGDLGYFQNENLFVTGRLKDVIIIGGRNHYPQDIEQTAEGSHPALRAGCCAVFSADFAGEERLIVVAEVERRYRPARFQHDVAANGDPNHYRPLDADEVVTAIRRAVAENHDLSIHSVLLLKTGSIPKTSSGKIQRQACRSSFLDGSLEVVMR